MTVTLESKRSERRSSLGSWLGGAGIGAAAAFACFWAGHQYWPHDLNTAAPSVSVQSGRASGAALMGLSENTIADIAAKAADSVVNIDTKTSITVAESPFQFSPFGGFNFFLGPGGMEPFMQEPGLRKFQQKGTGSGVIFKSDGCILTNNHVVGNAQDITVTLNDKRQFKGKVVGRDPYTDLAIVKIDANNLPVAQFGTAKNLRAGDWAIAIGSPMNLDHTVTLGIVSALGRALEINKGNVQLIQTDAAINPGNSGGPLLNIHGQVVGINVAIRGDAQNIGFSIPVDVAKDVANELLLHGSIGRPYLGVYMQDLDEKIAKSLGLPGNAKGVLIGKIAPNSPAEKCGLLQGDVITRIDGAVTNTSKDVQSIVMKHKPGEILNVLVMRTGGRLTAVPVKVGAYPNKDPNENE